MTGVRGVSGPPPKRESQRRRRNKAEPIEIAEGAVQVEIPEPAAEWHPAAARFYASLAESGQSQFYQPSDYALAWLVAEAISRELQPAPLVVGKGETARIEMVTLPPKASAVSAWMKAAQALLVTEGDRRRLRLELTSPADDDDESNNSGVALIEEYRRRAASAATHPGAS